MYWPSIHTKWQGILLSHLNKSLKHQISGQDCLIALKFVKCLNSNSAKMMVKYHKDMMILTLAIAALSLSIILFWDILE